jgi:hypothetical protein
LADRTQFTIYGLSINGDPSLGHRLSLSSTPLGPNSEPSQSAIDLDCLTGQAPQVGPAWILSEEAAHLRFSLGLIQASRAERTITITTSQRAELEAVVHPYLGFPCAAFNRWAGNDALHGGAFIVDGGAIVVCGARERGKSTLLAALAHRNVAVMTDDLVIIDAAQRVKSGPRCVDLRPEAHLSLGGQELNLPNDRGRRRLALPDCPLEVPLKGFVELAWGDTASITRLDMGATLALLDEAQFIPHGPARPASFLELLGVPAWRYTRPRDLSDPGRTIDTLLDTIG